jgi:hypothetical protein
MAGRGDRIRRHRQLSCYGHDGNRALLQYVLVHEPGHVIGLLAGIHDAEGDVPSRRRFFFGEAWLEAAVSRFDAGFPQRLLTHSGDDFAESFANDVHVNLLRRPFEVVTEENGQEVVRMGPCWDAPRCQRKRVASKGCCCRARGARSHEPVDIIQIMRQTPAGA